MEKPHHHPHMPHPLTLMSTLSPIEHVSPPVPTGTGCLVCVFKRTPLLLTPLIPMNPRYAVPWFRWTGSPYVEMTNYVMLQAVLPYPRAAIKRLDDPVYKFDALAQRLTTFFEEQVDADKKPLSVIRVDDPHEDVRGSHYYTPVSANNIFENPRFFVSSSILPIPILLLQDYTPTALATELLSQLEEAAALQVRAFQLSRYC